MSFLTFAQVHKAFGPKSVLQGLDLRLGQGESLVVIGRSGSGKSVMLRCLLGLTKPDCGTITLESRSLVGLRGAAQTALMDRLGMLFQSPALFDSLPVWRNIGFRLLHQRQPRVRQRVEALLNQVGLPAQVGTLYPGDLSGGMQKRVGLARALAGDPDLLLLDEPTTGLDPISGAQINSLIATLCKERGATTLTITHDLDSARKIADRLALLHGGRLVWQGPPAALEDDPDPQLRQFVDGREEGPLNEGSLDQS